MIACGREVKTGILLGNFFSIIIFCKMKKIACENNLSICKKTSCNQI